MDRVNLINHLIRQRNARRYLEIGAHGEHETYAHIRCDSRMYISPQTAENFFRFSRETFGIIFIDGIHTEEAVKLDLERAFNVLIEGGIIVLHDCMPPEAWYQRDIKEWKNGEAWTGKVWKTVLRVFNESQYRCTLLDTDWGCGIIDTASTQQPANRPLPEELKYRVHYTWLLEYRVTVEDYLREYVKVFYHLACMGDWQQVFREQMGQLKGNGFREISLSVLGTEDQLREARSVLDDLGIGISGLVYENDLACFERPALKAIENYARANNGYVLYLHSKGVSNPADHTKAKWRRLMMQELVENWRNCVQQLMRYDIIGVNWRDMPPLSHFCGNFWYASANYLRKLADFNTYYDNPRYKIWDAINDKRLGCEFWISSARETPGLLSLAYRNVDFCNHEFWSDK